MMIVLCILGIILFIIFILLIIFPFVYLNKFINTRVDLEEIDASTYGLNSKRVVLNTRDKLDIVCHEVKCNDSRTFIIILSGIHKPSVTFFYNYAKVFYDNGWSSLLIEMRSHGKSDGNKIGLGVLEYLDVLAGVEYIKNKYPESKIVVLGTSMGGATAINSIGMIDQIDGVVSLSAYSSFQDVFIEGMHKLGIPKILCELERPFINFYMLVEFGVKNLFVNPKHLIKKIGSKPIFIAHSTQDTQININNYKRIKKNIPIKNNNVHTFLRDGNNHFILFDKYKNDPIMDTDFVGSLVTFIKKYFI